MSNRRCCMFRLLNNVKDLSWTWIKMYSSQLNHKLKISVVQVLYISLLHWIKRRVSVKYVNGCYFYQHHCRENRDLLLLKWRSANNFRWVSILERSKYICLKICMVNIYLACCSQLIRKQPVVVALFCSNFTLKLRFIIIMYLISSAFLCIFKVITGRIINVCQIII